MEPSKVPNSTQDFLNVHLQQAHYIGAVGEIYRVLSKCHSPQSMSEVTGTSREPPANSNITIVGPTSSTVTTRASFSRQGRKRKYLLRAKGKGCPGSVPFPSGFVPQSLSVKTLSLAVAALHVKFKHCTDLPLPINH